VAELRKDRNHYRKMTSICLGIMLPLVVAAVILLAVIYWDLSHPNRGKIDLGAYFQTEEVQ